MHVGVESIDMPQGQGLSPARRIIGVVVGTSATGTRTAPNHAERRPFITRYRLTALHQAFSSTALAVFPSAIPGAGGCEQDADGPTEAALGVGHSKGALNPMRHRQARCRSMLP